MKVRRRRITGAEERNLREERRVLMVVVNSSFKSARMGVFLGDGGGGSSNVMLRVEAEGVKCDGSEGRGRMCNVSGMKTTSRVPKVNIPVPRSMHIQFDCFISRAAIVGAMSSAMY